jgi:hypothetical protein
VSRVAVLEEMVVRRVALVVQGVPRAVPEAAAQAVLPVVLEAAARAALVVAGQAARVARRRSS